MTIWVVINTLVNIVGWVGSFLLILGGVATLVAWIRGIFTPLWRLGLGLSRRKITVVASTDDCNSLGELLSRSALFRSHNARFITSADDIQDIESAQLVLLKLNSSPIALRDIVDRLPAKAALVIYAKPKEISDSQWETIEKVRYASVANVRGRLLTDLLNAMMTTGYDKK